MTGQDLYQILMQRGLKYLYHANSVATSLSMLKLGGIASRDAVERKGLRQTNQISDADDKKYNIWNDVFLDMVDIHRVMGNRNHYGPVMFVLSVDVLLNLPVGSSIKVTRVNPTNWKDLPQLNQRYFGDSREVAAEIRIGDLGQMITITTPSGLLPFGSALIEVILDEPRVVGSGNSEEYLSACQALSEAIFQLGLNSTTSCRKCAPFCKCKNATGYLKKSTTIPFFFKF